jgi:hypothetical protein
MNKALALSEAKTKARFESREDRRFRRGGYGHTAEFAAVMKDGVLERLADHIRKRLKGRDDYGLREASADNLAGMGMASLLHSIHTETDEPARSIDIGLVIQTELWAAGLLSTTRKRIAKSRRRVWAARAAGYRENDWTQAQRLKVGNWFLKCCLEALPDFF